MQRLLPYLCLIFVAITMTVGCGQRDGRTVREMYDDYMVDIRSLGDSTDIGGLLSLSQEIHALSLQEGNDTIAAHTANEICWLYGETKPEKMIEWSRKAQTLYKKIDMPSKVAFARIGEIRALYLLHRWDEALGAARDYDATLYDKDADYRYYINSYTAHILEMAEDSFGSNAQEIIRLMTEIDCDNPDKLRPDDRATLAKYLFYVDDMENAFNQINRAVTDDGYCGFRVIPYFVKAQMLAELKDFSHAYGHMCNAFYLLDSLSKDNIRAEVKSSEGITDYYKLKVENERLALGQSRAINVALGLGIVLVIVIAIAVVSRIRTRNRQQVAEMSVSMARLEADILDSHRISDTMRDRLKALFADRFDTFNEICELWYRNNESAAATADMKRGMEALIARVSDPALADELDALIDSCSDGWMTHLRTACPDLNDDQRRLARYLFTGFSSESIMILTRRSSVNAVYVAKSRLKKAISDSGAPDTDEILAILGLAKKAGE